MSSPLSYCGQSDMSRCQSNTIPFILQPLNFKSKESFSTADSFPTFPWGKCRSQLSLGLFYLFSIMLKIKHKSSTILEEYNSRLLDHTSTIEEVWQLPAGEILPRQI